jgi:CheY-like chemotaxis protein
VTGAENLPNPETANTQTILVVDDHEAVRELAARMLQRVGYATLEAANGEKALALFRQHRSRIGLVLTDVRMPGMSGFELVKRMREEGGDLPVLYMSGYLSMALAVQYGPEKLDLDLGFLQKPFAPKTLQEKVQRLLAATPVAR